MQRTDNELDIAVDGDDVFENEHYIVGILELGPDGDMYTDGKFAYRTCYAVINKQTDVIEHVCVQLPEAIFCAVGLAAALDKAPWKWAKDVVEAANLN